MSESRIQYPQLTEDLKEGLTWRSLKYFGAGAIIASVTIGSGETLFASRGGAIFGYTLLWVFVMSAIMKGVQVYSAARYMTLTGEHPMTHWGLMPGPKNWVPLAMGAMSLFCFPFWQGALPRVLGNIVNWIFGVSGSAEMLVTYERLWGTAAILVVMWLTIFQSYGFLEKGQTLIVGVLLGCLFVATFAARPDWFAALVGLIKPTIPEYEPWVVETYDSIANRPAWVEVATYLGAIGGGTYDYIGYIGCFREKAWGAIGLAHEKYKIDLADHVGPLPIDTSEENVRRGRRWLLPAQIDTGIGFLCVLIFTICFVLLGAVILYPQQTVPEGNDLLSHQAQFLTNLHPALLYVYQLGIFMAFFGTIYGAYEIYVRTAFECLVPISRKVREMPFARFRVIIVIYCGTLGLVFLWTMNDPVKMITPAAIVGGVFTCSLWCLAMIWADRRFLPKELRMGRFLLTLTWISGIVLTTLGVKAIYDYLVQLLS